MKARKALSIVLLICFVITCTSCVGNTPSSNLKTPSPVPSASSAVAEPTNSPAPISEADRIELEQAAASGIIPEGLSYEGNITVEEYLALLHTCIRLKSGNPKILDDRLKVQSGDVVLRKDAAIGLNLTANAIGLDPKRPNTSMAVNGKDTILEWESTLFKFNSTEMMTSPNMGANLRLRWVALYALAQYSYANGYRLMELDDNGDFRYEDPLTRIDAIQAVYRLYTSMMPEPRYVSIEDVGPHTISADTLANRKALPPMTASNIPNTPGVFLQNKSSVFWDGGMDGSRCYEEDVIRFLGENGFHFARLDLSFSSLSAPDYGNGKINLNELEELDKLISWGLKYGVHICIDMSELPDIVPEEGQGYLDQYNDENHVRRIFTDQSIRQKVKQYWNMLAVRYADIPPENLSFLMMVEPEAPNEKVYAQTYEPIIRSIWDANPNRVVFNYADPSYPNGEQDFNTTVAQMGCPMAWSFYKPCIINYYGAEGTDVKERYPYIDPPVWPPLYLPASFDSGNAERNTLIINSDKPINEINIMVDKLFTDSSAVLSVYANETVVDSKRFSIAANEDPNSFPQESWSVKLPKNASSVKLIVSGKGILQHGRIQLNLEGMPPVNLFPHDGYTADPNAIMPILHIDDQGKPSVEGSNLAVDFDYLYNWDMKWILDKCQQYNVGFLVSEWGPFGTIDRSDSQSYREMVIAGFKKYNIPWNINYVGPLKLLISKCNDLNGPDLWKLLNKRYIKIGYSNKYYYDSDLLEIIKKYS